MLKVSFKHIYILIIGLVAYLATYAQEPIRFQNLTVNDGLSMGTITAFEQDSKGYTWIATAEGLHRYDGKYFKIFKHVEGAKNSLHDSYITCLKEIDNQLYIGNNLGSVDVMDLDNYTFKNISFKAADESFDYPITNFARYQYTLYITTDRGGIWEMDLNSNAITKNKFSELNNVLNSFVYPIKNSYLVLNGSSIYKCTKTQIINVFTNQQLQFSSIAKYKDNYLVGTNRGLFIMDLNFTQLTPIKLPPKKRLLHKITSIQVRDNNAWIGSVGGLMHYDDGVITHYTTNPLRPFSLVNNQVTCLFIDQQSIVWIGTISGVSKYAPQLKKFGLVQYFDYNDLTYNNNVYYVYEDRNSAIWLGTLTSGLVKLAKDHSIEKVFPLIKDGIYETKAIRCIYEDSKGTFWLGTRDEGLFRFNPSTGKSKLIANVENGKISSNVIREIFEDVKGQLWLGTQNGLYSIDSAYNFTHFPSKNNNNNSVYQIEQHPSKNELIIATFRGGLQFFNLDTKKFRVLKHDANDSFSISNNNVMSLAWLNKDTLLIGTYGGGLNIFDINTEKSSHVTEEDGLINNSVYGIAYEGNGTCWLSTNNGLVRYSIYTHKFINFKPEHYLQNTEYNEGAFLKSSTGYYYFGGVTGLNYFKPKNINYDTTSAPVRFTDIRGEFDYTQPNSIRMNFLNSRLEIDFMSLYFINSDGVKYRYKLEGFDNNWIESQNSNTAVYPRLNPGNYTFKVIAEDEFGNWTSTSEELKVYVEPPIWQKWWFVTLAVLFVLGIIYALFKYRTREIERLYKLQLVDSELAALRSQMNPHFIFNSLNSIQYFILKKEPKEAYTYLSKFASLMRKILQNSRLKYISVEDEVQWLNLYLEMEKMRMDNNLEYSITTENIDDLETTHIPTMLIQPFVENSIIHGLLPKENDRTLDVVISKESKHLVCSIKDNGIGRDASKIMNAKRSSKHASAGMDLTRKRLEILSEGKGNFDVQIVDLKSKGDATGTLVKILIPIIKKID